jgi:hypothetical protein
MQSLDDIYVSRIKSIRDDVISNIIDSATTDITSPYDKEFNWAERLNPIKRLQVTTIKWCSNWLVGLDKFPFMYVTDGNTDYLVNLFNRTNNIAWKKDDYSYYQHWHVATGKPYTELTEPASVDDLLVSWPGYNYGDDTELNFANQCTAQRRHLDCAYLGVVKPNSLDVSDYETVGISFSKTLSIPYNRIGVCFSKTEIKDISMLNKMGYVNLSGVKLATHIMKHLPPSYFWDTYGDEKLNELCKKHNLTKTDSILIAYDNEKRVGLAPYWQKND